MKKIYLYLTLLFFPVIISAQEISIVSIANGFSTPVNIQNAGDDRLFIVEKGGRIKILNSDGTTNSMPFLDISGQVSGGSEQGLLGLAFHPDYATNGFFYVNYTKTNGDTRVSRFSVDSANPDLADATSELEIIEIPQPFTNHNGGCILFGPDGYLYIASGDGGSGGDPGNRAQNTTLLLGKMLRLDVDNPVIGGTNYGIPPDNPFAGSTVNAQEIWAYGVRNPWKFSFDRDTGDLWIADVGQNAIEEINRVASTEAGLNYGWRCYEGSQEFLNGSTCPPAASLTFPIAEYPHSVGQSITGGYVYRGTEYPDIEGLYFFADFVSGIIGTVDASGTLINHGSFGGNYSSFGEDQNGELYVASFGGTIYQVTGEIIVGVESFNGHKFTLFPNPATDLVTIQSEKTPITAVEIFDVLGSRVFSKNENTPQIQSMISVEGLSSGMYMVRIHSEKGSVFKKLILRK